MTKIKKFVGETLIYGFANVFSRIFAMLLIPFYAKFLGKTDYSNLVMLQSVFSVLTFLLALNSGVFYYYYKYFKADLKRRIFTSWFYYGIVTSLFIFLIILPFSGVFANFFVLNDANIDSLNISICLVGVQLIPYVFNNTVLNYYRIIREPKKVMYLIFVEAILTAAFVTIILYKLNGGLVGVMIGQIVARGLTSILFLKRASYFLNYKFCSLIVFKKIFFYSWPFFVISFFGWIITSIDKFIGAQLLTNKADIALLSFAMQLVIPITVLSDMIRMAIGPFVMSIHKEKDANDTYQKVFDLSIFSSIIIIILIIIMTPYFTVLLTDKSFLGVIYIVPLMAFSNVFSMAANQFSISFNLSMKNVYILYGTVLAGIVGVLFNIVFMEKYGYVIAALSQVLSYFAMALFLFLFGKKRVGLKIDIRLSVFLIGLLLIYISLVSFEGDKVVDGQFFSVSGFGFLFIAIITFIYLRIQKINLRTLIKK